MKTPALRTVHLYEYLDPWGGWRTVSDTNRRRLASSRAGSIRQGLAVTSIARVPLVVTHRGRKRVRK